MHFKQNTLQNVRYGIVVLKHAVVDIVLQALIDQLRGMVVVALSDVIQDLTLEIYMKIL
jgi:hypothetical protein